MALLRLRPASLAANTSEACDGQAAADHASPMADEMHGSSSPPRSRSPSPTNDSVPLRAQSALARDWESDRYPNAKPGTRPHTAPSRTGRRDQVDTAFELSGCEHNDDGYNEYGENLGSPEHSAGLAVAAAAAAAVATEATVRVAGSATDDEAVVATLASHYGPGYSRRIQEQFRGGVALSSSLWPTDTQLDEQQQQVVAAPISSPPSVSTPPSSSPAANTPAPGVGLATVPPRDHITTWPARMRPTTPLASERNVYAPTDTKRSPIPHETRTPSLTPVMGRSIKVVLRVGHGDSAGLGDIGSLPSRRPPKQQHSTRLASAEQHHYARPVSARTAAAAAAAVTAATTRKQKMPGTQQMFAGLTRPANLPGSVAARLMANAIADASTLSHASPSFPTITGGVAGAHGGSSDDFDLIGLIHAEPAAGAPHHPAAQRRPVSPHRPSSAAAGGTPTAARHQHHPLRTLVTSPVSASRTESSPAESRPTALSPKTTRPDDSVLRRWESAAIREDAPRQHLPKDSQIHIDETEAATSVTGPLAIVEPLAIVVPIDSRVTKPPSPASLELALAAAAVNEDSGNGLASLQEGVVTTPDTAVGGNSTTSSVVATVPSLMSSGHEAGNTGGEPNTNHAVDVGITSKKREHERAFTHNFNGEGNGGIVDDGRDESSHLDRANERNNDEDGHQKPLGSVPVQSPEQFSQRSQPHVAPKSIAPRSEDLPDLESTYSAADEACRFASSKAPSEVLPVTTTDISKDEIRPCHPPVSDAETGGAQSSYATITRSPTEARTMSRAMENDRGSHTDANHLLQSSSSPSPSGSSRLRSPVFS